MTAEPAMTGKVAAFVTRPSRTAAGAVELLVFQHPLAGVQLPAGSLFDGEDPTVGVWRELHEEAGLGADDVELVGEIGSWVQPDSGLTRHAYHFRCVRETPDEWWVLTPDGGGLCWRCHWTALDGTEWLHADQRWWLDRVRHRILDHDDRPLRPWAPLPDGLAGDATADLFAGMPGQMKWYSTTWLPGAIEGDDSHVMQSTAVAVTEDGSAVIATHEDGQRVLPGGTREAGETLWQTLARELHEEACATIVDAELLGLLRVVTRDSTDGSVADVRYGARWWARVELDPWEPRWEMVDRCTVPYTDVVGELTAWRHPSNARWITAAIEAERRRRA